MGLLMIWDLKKSAVGNAVMIQANAMTVFLKTVEIVPNINKKGGLTMRENMGLYRGKRKDTGEWVYGDLIHDKGEQKEHLFIWYETDTFPFVNEAEVDPETVGQYTGLTDKNGTRIFEGDILSVHFDDLFPKKESRYLFPKEGSRYEAVWYDYGGHIKSGSGFFDTMEQNWINMFLEVIGNIHDNPELLEG